MNVNINALDGMDNVLWTQTNGVSKGYVYSPFGSTSARGDSDIPLAGFNGERLDPVSQTYNLGNGYRCYSPKQMRFISPDSWSPFGNGGLNQYAYCEGDPINRSDPSGHLSRQAAVGIGLGILGLLGTVFSVGMSIAAAGGVMAAFSSASAVDVITSTAEIANDLTSIACGATSEENPATSQILGWLAFGVGMFGAFAGIAHASKAIYAKLTRTDDQMSMLHDQLLERMRPRVNSLPSSDAMPHPNSIRRFSVDESLSGVDLAIYPVDIQKQDDERFRYFTNQERSACELTAGDYGCIKFKQSGNILKDGSYNFAYSSEGRFYAGDTKFHHSTFMSGAAIKSAGTMEVCNGRIVNITNKSGHYAPARKKFLDATKEMVNRGFILPSASIAMLPRPYTYNIGDLLNKGPMFF